MISDLFCDGLGACIGHCPEDAIEIMEREAEPYNELKVLEFLVPQGRNTILAHLDHLRNHGEQVFLNEAIQYLKENKINMSEEQNFPTDQLKNNSQETFQGNDNQHEDGSGCPGALFRDFNNIRNKVEKEEAPITGNHVQIPSELKQWPVQLHLLNPQASYFHNADVLLAADCVAFVMGNFHSKYIKGRSIAIACPKLDSNKESYVQKITSMIFEAKINSLTVVMMEVPCCGGLLQMAKMAKENSGKNIPIKMAIVGLQGDVIKEEWV